MVNTTVPETAIILTAYIENCLNTRRKPSGGEIIALLLNGAEKSAEFFCIKETEELIYFKEDTNKYSTEGKEMVHSFCEAVLRNSNAVQYAHTSPIMEVENHIRRNSYVSMEEFDKEPLTLLPLANGIYDLETGELLPYSAEHRFLNTLAVAFNPEAKCPNFEMFLDDVCVDNEMKPDLKMRQSIIQLFAYTLWRGFPIQNVFFLIGGGANGKGVLLGTLQAMLGNDNVANRSILALSDNRFAGADLHRKHANISNELTVDEVDNVDLLKSLVSGTDYISAERKHQQPFTFMNYAKIIIATNAPPKANDATDGFYRRLNLIRFTRQFFGVDDKKDLPTKLKQPEELSGILNLALAELRLWLREDGFNPESTFANYMPVDEMRVLYERLADSVSAFRYDCLDITQEEDDYVVKDDMFKAYRNYCVNKKVGANTEAKFWREFRTQTIGTIMEKRIGSAKIRAFAGVVLKDDKTPTKEAKVSGYPSNPPLAAIKQSNTLEQSIKLDGYHNTKVLILKDLPIWVGVDGKTYGTYKKGEIMELPVKEVAFLLSYGLCRIVL